MNAQNEQRVQHVYDSLRNGIIRGDLFPGEKINEQEISDRLGVSRTPVREAIRQLEREGLVRVQHYRGAFVVKLGVQEIKDIFETREALEGMAARLASTRMSKSKMYSASSALEEQLAQLSAGEDVPPATDLHDLILEGSKNRQLVTTMSRLRGQLATLRYVSTRGERRRLASNEEHRVIIEALLQRQPDQAEAAMRAHVRSVCTNLLKLKEGGVNAH